MTVALTQPAFRGVLDGLAQPEPAESADLRGPNQKISNQTQGASVRACEQAQVNNHIERGRWPTWTSRNERCYRLPAENPVEARPDSRKPHSEKWGLTCLYLVAGAGFEPATFGL